jgi:hypothetical protein
VMGTKCKSKWGMVGEAPSPQVLCRALCTPQGKAPVTTPVPFSTQTRHRLSCCLSCHCCRP